VAVVLGFIGSMPASQAGADATTIAWQTTASVTLQQFGRDVATPVTGQVVWFGAKLVADRSRTFDEIIFVCRTPTGANCDFGHTGPYTVGTTQQVFTRSTSFATAGNGYQVGIAYRVGTVWTNLAPNPAQTFNVTAASTNPNPVGPTGTWNLRFRDEFAGTAVDGSKWQYRSTAESDWSTTPFGTGNPGNQQLEFDQPANCSVANGQLTMLAKPDNITSQSGTHYNWSSCLLVSTGTAGYSYQWGYIEVRAQLPAPKGFWPAFWTWQTTGRSTWDETDVFEFYSDNHGRLYHNKHPNGGSCTTLLNNGVAPDFDPSTGMHIYGAESHAGGTTFYVDGVAVCTVTGTHTGSVNIVLDNFVYAGIPPAPGTQGVLQVDYVRAWQR
jgi:beta-glucanase (GH16 family)